MKPHTLKIISGKKSGYVEIRCYPENKNFKSRGKKCKKSIRSQVRVNERNAFETCYLEAIENFSPDDYCLTVTFPDGIGGLERLRIFKNLIKWLQRLYQKHGKVLRYMYFVGRGNQGNNIHYHILINNETEITWEMIVKKQEKNGKIILNLRKIRRYHDCEDQMIICIIYLFRHRGTLTEEDAKIYKKFWYPSHGLSGFDIETDTIDGNRFMAKCRCANNKGKENLESYLQSVFPELRLKKYGPIGESYKDPIYYDSYGRIYCRLIFARKGSTYDTGSYVYHTHGIAMDSITHMVIADDS